MLESRTLEAAEAELNRFIDRRASPMNHANELQEMWKASERKHREKLREENRWQWIRYFDRMAASHAQLAEENRQKAAALLDGQGERREES